MTDQPTDPRDTITDGDFRRATALLTHYVTNDNPGVLAVIEEAEAADRMRGLVWGLTGVFIGLSPSWNAQSVPVLREFVRVFAERESA